MKVGPWMDAVITIATDNDLSAAVALDDDYECLDIIIPTIDSADIALYVAENVSGTYVQFGTSDKVLSAGTGGFADTLKLGGRRNIKIGTSAVQTANRTFRVRGRS